MTEAHPEDTSELPANPSRWRRLARLPAAGGDTPLGCVLLVMAGLATAVVWAVVPRWRRSRAMRRPRA